METKQCNAHGKCIHPNGPDLPLDEFSRCADRKDGRREMCKKCHAKSRRDRRANDPEHAARIRTQQRREYTENPVRREYVKEKSREYYAEVKEYPSRLKHKRQLEAKRRKERIATDTEYASRLKQQQHNQRCTDEFRQRRLAKHLERMQNPDYRDRFLEMERQKKQQPTYKETTNARRRWRMANDLEFRDRIHQHHKVWQRKFPHHFKAAQKRAKANRRAREKAAPGSHTTADVLRQYEAQQGRCYYCGIELGLTYHEDHILPLRRGGSNWPENIVCACPDCNLRKGSKTLEEWGWYKHCKLPT